MTERKPSGESFESFTERKIREAQAEGAFDKLPGLGRPIPNIGQPLDENWWIREKLRRERLSALPPIVQARLEAEKTLAEIEKLPSEAQVRRRLEALNARIREAHYSHIPGPPEGVRPVDVEAAVVRWKARRRESAG